jgi:NIMA (never in mitosis gene a)-related kinase
MYLVPVVVIKDLEIQNLESNEDWKKEVTVMCQNRSPYIADIFGYASKGNTLTIVMEFFEFGDLFGILHKHPLSLLHHMRMARHCALGLAFLHRNQVLHRDIKSMNVLVRSDYACKLTDLGCVKLLSEQQMYHTIVTGTPLWMAPEVKSGGVYIAFLLMSWVGPF